MISQRAAVGLLIFIQIFALSPYLFETGITYDGGLYASLGWSLYSEQSYSFNGQPGDVPPGFPLLIAPFFVLGEKGIYIGPLITSFVLVISSYFLLEKRFGTLFGFFGALLVFTSKMIYTYSAYVLRDLPALAFVMLAYLLYERVSRSHSGGAAVLFGPVMAFAFLTKYTSMIALMPLMICAFYKKEGWFLISLFVLSLLVVPWSLWSIDVHDTLLVEHTTHYIESAALGVGGAAAQLKMFNGWFFPLLIPLFVVGVFLEIKEKRARAFGNPYILLFVFTLIAFLLWPIKSERYLLPAVFPVVYFAVALLQRGPKSIVAPILLLFVFGQLWAGVHHIDTAKKKYVLLEDAGHWIADNTEEDSRVMTQSFRQTAFYSKRKVYEVPKRDWVLPGFVKRYNVTHILIDSYEKTTPRYLYDFVEEQGYREAARFNDGYGDVVIYEV
jgi:hypothetical protein